MIRRVELKDYGPFASAELELSPLTVIVGPNASGKSKILEILHSFGSEVCVSLHSEADLSIIGRRKYGQYNHTQRPSVSPHCKAYPAIIGVQYLNPSEAMGCVVI